MENTKLKEIIERKNDRLERDALNEAENIIEAIASKQNLIQRTQEEIVRLREDLVALQIQQIDPATILGNQEVG